MTTHQKQALFLAIVSALCLCGVGFSLAAGSILFAVIFLVAGLLLIGTGFILKSIRRKNGTL